jgi:hypothetical protein
LWGDTEKENNQKSQRTLANKSPERLALNSPFHIPSEERLRSSGLASDHTGSVLDGGGGSLTAAKEAGSFRFPRDD